MNGVPCPNCGWHESSVRDSRPYPDSIRRRRCCASCATTYRTVEVVVPNDGVVLKPGIGQTPPTVMSLTRWTERLKARLAIVTEDAFR